ncbi:MAG: hypothetical protein R3296_06240 [Oleiphilaceae bacterium]|nr:hypothetical protein [Oleiphilaceae bacterium]
MIRLMDDWCDQRLSAEQQRDCAGHLEHCGDCRVRLKAEQRRREALATLTVPEPDAGFEQRMLDGAIGGRHRRGWTSPMIGTAMAACLAVGLMVGQWMDSGPPLEQVGAPEASLAENRAENDAPAESPEPVSEEVASEWGLDEPDTPVANETVETVRLAFSAGKAMEDVTLTLEMPAHMELAAFPGERTISWKVDLQEGQNLLSLPVRNLFPGQGELVAHLDDGERRKTFRAPVGTESPETTPAERRDES